MLSIKDNHKLDSIIRNYCDILSRKSSTHCALEPFAFNRYPDY